MSCCGCVSSFVWLVGLFVILKKLFPVLKGLFKGKEELGEPNFKKDTVYFYQFPGTPTLSSPSPYCVKVEAFLRLHKIPFERRDTFTRRGANGKLPYVELNGERISDSQVIIQKLCTKFNINEFASPEQAATARALGRMTDNHTSHVLMNFRKDYIGRMIQGLLTGKVHPMLLGLLAPLGGFLMKFQGAKALESAFGFFSDAEYKDLLRADLTAIQSLLGAKRFILGDKPTLADCTVFGQLGSTYYLLADTPAYPVQLLNEPEFSRLKAWLARFRDDVFGSEFHA